MGVRIRVARCVSRAGFPLVTGRPDGMMAAKTRALAFPLVTGPTRRRQVRVAALSRDLQLRHPLAADYFASAVLAISQHCAATISADRLTRNIVGRFAREKDGKRSDIARIAEIAERHLR
jgi:hypothetical protein